MRKSHCKRGHSLADDNVYSYIAKSGRQKGHIVRQCRTCTRGKNDKRAAQLRESHLNRKYGITSEQYDSMLLEQDSKCYVCKTDTPGGMGVFHVDHCHKTGQVRKLLCVRCNSCLGQVDDNVELLEKLAVYVKSHQ